MILLTTALLLLHHQPLSASQPRLRLVLAVTDSGTAAPEWLDLLRRRLTPAEFQAVLSIRRPLTGAEQAWADLFRSRIAVWEQTILPLARLFHPIAPPHEARIVLGNRGGEDAFTVPDDLVSIGFDLAKLQSIYGDAGRTVDRADRFFRHEYVHLLQKAWLRTHPYDARSPLRGALLEIWSEGMGNWFSMSDQWRSAAGRQSERATQHLAELEPRFVARLAALACASDAMAARLTSDLSWGPFDQKWGALTVALWLEAQPAEPNAVLRQFVLDGPDGLWNLAERSIAPQLRAVLAEARAQEERCRRGTQ